MLHEQIADVGDGIELCYESLGDPSDPTVLLVMGLGMQMVGWHDDFCAALVERGPFHVVRFDNRDSGRSTHVDAPAPRLAELIARRIAHVPYRLSDMARDAVGLLDHLGVERAHVVGVSMGGMIAQTVAARHPRRVASLTSIMSTTGSRRVGQAAFAILPALIAKAPAEREPFADHVVAFFRKIGSPASAYEPDDAWVREQALRAWDRSTGASPGQPRQLAAIVASGDRTSELARVVAPTLVVHGTHDRLIKPSGGKATARAIHGSRLVIVPGMGHDLPREIWPRLLDEIVKVAARATPEVGVPWSHEPLR